MHCGVKGSYIEVYSDIEFPKHVDNTGTTSDAKSTNNVMKLTDLKGTELCR